METVLKAHKVRKVYGSKGNLFSALGSISLEIQKGSFVGIMGPSGAGKSTLLNVLSSIEINQPLEKLRLVESKFLL